MRDLVPAACSLSLLLRGAAAAGLGHLADVIEEDGLLCGGEVGSELGDLGEEGVGGEQIAFGLVALGGIAEQGGDVDLEGAGETVEGAEGRHGFAIFNFGDVGARHVHAGGELALRQVTDPAKIANGVGYLQRLIFGFGGRRLVGDESDGALELGLVGEQGLLAATADVGVGAELYELAVLALEDLAIRRGDGNADRCRGCFHVVCCGRLPERGTAAPVV